MAKDWEEKYISDRIEADVEAYRFGLNEIRAGITASCESQIEIALGFALAMTLDGACIPSSSARTYFAGEPYTNWPSPMGGGLDKIVIFPQSKIGNYRADFLILCELNDRHFWVVVECDGHDFHERSKEQARRDRSRDRWMTANKISVLRFTGSEIFKDPDACAEQVADFIASKFGELI